MSCAGDLPTTMRELGRTVPWTQWTPSTHVLVLRKALWAIKVLPTNSILFFTCRTFEIGVGSMQSWFSKTGKEHLPKEFLRWAVYKCVQLLSVLLQLPHPNGFVPGWGGCTLQGAKMTSWVYFAMPSFRTPNQTKLKKSLYINIYMWWPYIQYTQYTSTTNEG